MSKKHPQLYPCPTLMISNALHNLDCKLCKLQLSSARPLLVSPKAEEHLVLRIWKQADVAAAVAEAWTMNSEGILPKAALGALFHLPRPETGWEVPVTLQLSVLQEHIAVLTKAGVCLRSAAKADQS